VLCVDRKIEREYCAGHAECASRDTGRTEKAPPAIGGQSPGLHDGQGQGDPAEHSASAINPRLVGHRRVRAGGTRRRGAPISMRTKTRNAALKTVNRIAISLRTHGGIG
jgi:hypothetical protein